MPFILMGSGVLLSISMICGLIDILPRNYTAHNEWLVINHETGASNITKQLVNVPLHSVKQIQRQILL